jgi:hypothetical protein
MKNALITAFSMLMLLTGLSAAPAGARIITALPITYNTGCCGVGTDTVLVSSDLSASPVAFSFPNGSYATCPDYRNDFYVGMPCTNQLIGSGAFLFR